MDKKKLLSSATKYTNAVKYVPKVKKGINLALNAKKNKGKITKGKVTAAALTGYVALCLVKRKLKY